MCTGWLPKDVAVLAHFAVTDLYPEMHSSNQLALYKCRNWAKYSQKESVVDVHNLETRGKKALGEVDHCRIIMNCQKDLSVINILWSGMCQKCFIQWQRHDCHRKWWCDIACCHMQKFITWSWKKVKWNWGNLTLGCWEKRWSSF